MAQEIDQLALLVVGEVEAVGEEEGEGVVVEGKPKRVAIVLCKWVAVVFFQLKVLVMFAIIMGGVYHDSISSMCAGYYESL